MKHSRKQNIKNRQKEPLFKKRFFFLRSSVSEIIVCNLNTSKEIKSARYTIIYTKYKKCNNVPFIISLCSVPSSCKRMVFVCLLFLESAFSMCLSKTMHVVVHVY